MSSINSLSKIIPTRQAHNAHFLFIFVITTASLERIEHLYTSVIKAF